MRYYHNGKQVSSSQAKEIALKGYYEQGYCCPVEFSDVWEGIHNEEEHRDTVFNWSGYTLEIFTDEEDEALDD